MIKYLYLIFCIFLNLFSLSADQEEGFAEKPEIEVFIHACTLGNWQEVLHRQLGRIQASGLYEACHSISIGVLGTGNMAPFIERYPKIEILFQNPNTALYENPTLTALRSRAALRPDTLLMYIHTKGITKQGNQNVTDWTKYLEYFVIDNWQDCVAALKENDICGVNWRLDPKPHFNGNFWWATSRYVSTLPNHINVQFIPNTPKKHVGNLSFSEYVAPEMWLGQNSPKVKCFHESHIVHYFHPYPESRYIKGRAKGRNFFSLVNE